MKLLLTGMASAVGLVLGMQPAFADSGVAATTTTTSSSVSTSVTTTTAAVPPDVVVKTNTDKLQKLINDNHVKYQADLPAFYKVVDEVIVPHFDVPFIARSVLGKNWRGASEAQRQRFSEAFKNMLIRSYANALLQYADSVKADFKPLRMTAGADDVTVNSSLLRDGKPPVAIGFSMHTADSKWKIYDITVENISLVTNFRGQFNSEIKKSDLESLIARMESGELSARKVTATGAAGSGG
ncbi:MAG TPA: ABC transporter substrate-binding protein [Solimonas sp.]|nr:ABC transporter substrate-binding protein [Solimonas sp.]